MQYETTVAYTSNDIFPYLHGKELKKNTLLLTKNKLSSDKKVLYPCMEQNLEKKKKKEVSLSLSGNMHDFAFHEIFKFTIF